MNLDTMTTAERERLAYAEGFVKTAQLFAQLDDTQHALGEDFESVDELREALDDKDRSIDQLGCQMHDLRAMLAVAEDERDTARAAVQMAIDLLEDPDAGADEATAVLNYLREALS